MVGRGIALAGTLLLACVITPAAAGQETADKAASPKLGEKAKAFKLLGLDKKPVELDKLRKDGPVVVVVLRGYPGYQCPLCSKQVGSFIAKSEQFEELGAKVVFVYPGPGKELETRALEFMKETKLPKPMTLVLDPDYKFTTAYGLRWNAPGETAYPSTFVVDAEGKVKFRVVSKSHGGRSEAADVLKALEAL